MRNPHLLPLNKRLTVHQQGRRAYRIFMRRVRRDEVHPTDAHTASWLDRLRSMFRG